MPHLLMLVVVSAGLLSGSAASAAGPAQSAPFLGGEKFTVHVSGTLRDVIQELQQATGWHVGLNTRGSGGQTVSMDAPVALEFDEAPLEEILLSLCEQAKLVYEGSGGGSKFLTLSPGDPKLDPRPTAALGDYTVRFTRLTVSAASSLDWRWGSPPPDPVDTYALTIESEVICKSQMARYALAGFDPKIAATCDTGLVLEGDKNAGMGWGGVIRGWSQRGPLSMNVTLRLDAPPEGPQMLSKIEGALRLYPEVKVTEIKIEPDSEGKTFEQDECIVTVSSWKQAGNMVSVALKEKHPLPPRDPQARDQPGGNDAFLLRVVSKDGKEQSPWGDSELSMPRYPGSDGTHQLNYSFQPPADLSHLYLTVIRRGKPDKILPFAIEKIPLP